MHAVPLWRSNHLDFFIVDGATSVGSFVICSTIHEKTAVPPDNNERERAEHTDYNTTYKTRRRLSTLTVTGQGLDGGKHPAENTTPEGDQEAETEQSLSDSLQTRQSLRIHENMEHT